MKKIILSLLLTLQAQAGWDLNDVTYLMPLPQAAAEDSLMHMDSEGLGGYLLHPNFLKQIPIMTLAMRPEEALKALRVVAVRIDPCFPLPVPQACQRQVRLIWQPLQLDRKQNIVTADAALHSFYILNDQQFYSLLKDISYWKSRYPSRTSGQALQVHPAWARTGTQSPALLAFQKMLQKHIGMQNFFRVTGMFLRGAGNMWAFANFEMENNELRPQPIARLGGKRAQTFINLAIPSDHFDGGGMAPQPQGQDTLDFLMQQTNLNDSQSEQMILQSFKSLYRIENPRTYNPENMDCVSCHVAQPLKYAFFTKRPELKLQNAWQDQQYQNSKYNLANLSVHPNDTQIIRGLGYFGSDVVVSQRVINESAEVADWLNTYLR